MRLLEVAKKGVSWKHPAADSLPHDWHVDDTARQVSFPCSLPRQVPFQLMEQSLSQIKSNKPPCCRLLVFLGLTTSVKPWNCSSCYCLESLPLWWCSSPILPPHLLLFHFTAAELRANEGKLLPAPDGSSCRHPWVWGHVHLIHSQGVENTFVQVGFAAALPYHLILINLSPL